MISHAISTYLVEDHFAVREGLKSLFKYEAKDEIFCCGEATNETEALAGILIAHPDVVVVDLNLENSNGLTLIEKLIQRNPQERIVVYSMRSIVQTISAAYRLGALAYVTKADSPSTLLDAIRAAAEGRTYLVPEIAEKLALYQVSGDKNNPRNILSEKELELLIMLAEGVRPEEAAKLQGISNRSLGNRIVTIRKILNCTDTEFTRIAIKYGLINSI